MMHNDIAAFVMTFGSLCKAHELILLSHQQKIPKATWDVTKRNHAWNALLHSVKRRTAYTHIP